MLSQFSKYILEHLFIEATDPIFLYCIGIRGYKIHFDNRGNAEFNLTLLDLQEKRKID